jgi:outer membrane receptor protein involved in Fe transport
MGGDWESRFGTFGSRIYSSTQLFDQNFSAVAADRNSETPTRIQRVPAQVIGFSLQWSRALGKKQTIVSGVEAREVRGSSDEIVFAQGRPTSLIGAGGRQRDSAVYFKDILQLTSRFSIIGGGRVDYWRNYLAHSDTKALSTNVTSAVERFSDRSQSAFSPQLAVVYRHDNNVSVVGSLYRGFRAPTLNELYRSFRVGNIFTLANAALRAEKLKGVEGGLIFNSSGGRFALRGTLFRSVIDNSIANVTLGATPVLTTRQRLNLGTIRSQGLEVETDIRLNPHWNITGGYLLVASTVVRFPDPPSLEGLAVPQIPRHSVSVQVRYTDAGKLALGMQTRIVGPQFDDDLNQFRLPAYFTVDAILSRPVSHNVEIYAAVENLLNRRYVVGRTPIATIGPPVLVRAGFRFHFARK